LFVFFLDGDDIIPRDTVMVMLELLKKNRADFVYGRTKKTYSSYEELQVFATPKKPKHLVLKKPLLDVIRNNVVQLPVLCTKEVFLLSGGADENIFVQDESLCIRLAHAANKFILLEETARFFLLSPGETKNTPNKNHLSANKDQQHVDSFLAFYNFFISKSILTKKEAIIIKKKIYSNYWKCFRGKKNSLKKTHAFFIYLFSKLFVSKKRTSFFLPYLKKNLIFHFQNKTKIKILYQENS
jgi:hypothetical protein